MCCSNLFAFSTHPQVDWEIVMSELRGLPGVEEVHDLHIWSISSKSVSLTVHIKVRTAERCVGLLF